MITCKIKESFGLQIQFEKVEKLFDLNIVNELKNLIIKHHLILIKRVFFSIEEHIRFTEQFGQIEKLPFQTSQLMDYPEIFRVSNQIEHGLTDVGQSWHSDGVYKPHGSQLSIFYGVCAPRKGGETSFCNLHLAYNRAPSDLIKKTTDMKGVYNDNGLEKNIIQYHPITNQPLFYVKLSKRKKILGLDLEESEIIYNQIQLLLDNEGDPYVHRWETGDLIIADNFSLAHKSHKTHETCLKILHRTTTIAR